MQTTINWFPGFAAVICAKRAGSGYCDGNSFRILRIEKNFVQTHAARARLPFRAGFAAVQSREFMPRFSALLSFAQTNHWSAMRRFDRDQPANLSRDKFPNPRSAGR